MTCAEFQRVLPDIIETGGNEQEESHLRSCPICSDLVADLRYIAEAAKLLVPMEEPSPRVWDGIQKSLEREGVELRPTGPGRRLLSPKRWGLGRWMGMTLTVTLLAFGLLLYL